MDKERIFRKTIEIIEKSANPLTNQTTFTTAPKTRRHIKHSISGKRATAFMEHLWRIGFNRCKYKALKIQFIQFFGTNDQRVITKYLGRPETKETHHGNQILRLNLTQGKHALFSYSNTRKLEAKIGLMETLGFITLNKKNGWARIHHELMSYYSKQLSLESFPPRSPLQETSESMSSIQDYCVRHIEAGESERQLPVLGVEVDKRKKEEEEVIEHTHKCNKCNAIHNVICQNKNQPTQKPTKHITKETKKNVTPIPKLTTAPIKTIIDRKTGNGKENIESVQKQEFLKAIRNLTQKITSVKSAIFVRTTAWFTTILTTTTSV